VDLQVDTDVSEGHTAYIFRAFNFNTEDGGSTLLRNFSIYMYMYKTTWRYYMEDQHRHLPGDCSHSYGHVTLYIRQFEALHAVRLNTGGDSFQHLI
jgi:hypothetical protein